MSFGSKDVELEREIPRAQFLSGACFGHNGVDIGVISTKLHTSQNKFNPPSFQRPAPTASVKGVGGDHEGPASTSNIEREPAGATARLSEITNQSSHWAANW